MDKDMSNDREAFEKLFHASKPRASYIVRHRFFVPTEEGAAKLVAELQRKGFAAEHSRATFDDDWFVQAWQKVVLTEELVFEIRSIVEAAAESVGGEYAGTDVD